MSKRSLQELINEAVKTELFFLSEAREFQEPGKDRPWKKNDPTTIKQLEETFNWFHLSEKQLGSGDYFRFTPRVPKDPWVPMEDDFTKRISLAPSIKKAIEAVGGMSKMREHIYAADIKGYSGDDVNTIELATTFKNCPKTPGNKYGTKFSMSKWLRYLNKKDELTPDEKRNKAIKAALTITAPESYRTYEPTPVELPKRLRDEFYACVPDANKTKEVWTTEPEIFMRVAYFIEDDGWYANVEERLISPDDLYLTDAGAKVFNAIKAKADKISYSRKD